ncbi:hypothetical protein A7982_13627 [Minicystis rosea]|nr:hypothetical protein A7982_13627 [Minicystis rosea]
MGGAQAVTTKATIAARDASRNDITIDSTSRLTALGTGFGRSARTGSEVPAYPERRARRGADPNGRCFEAEVVSDYRLDDS